MVGSNLVGSCMLVALRLLVIEKGFAQDHDQVKILLENKETYSYINSILQKEAQLLGVIEKNNIWENN